MANQRALYFSGALVLTLISHHWQPSQCAGPSDNQNHVKALRKELFQTRGYDIMARPVLNYSHPINVSIYLDINYIKQLDVVTNVLESEGWIRLSWSDENLKWDSEKYGGLSDIRVRIDEVFRPDITIINSVEAQNVIRSTTHSDLILWNSGEIFWMPAISMKTICDVDLTNWPFDRQTCLYRFASWTYDGNSLELHNASEHIDLNSFVENAEWAPVDSRCEYKMHIYDESSHYPEVIYYLTIERKATIYRYTVYLPVLCASLLNLMSLFLDIRCELRFHLSSLSFVTLLLVLLYLGYKLGFGSLGIPRCPSPVMRALEPVQHWLVSSTDIEAQQLTNSEAEVVQDSAAAGKVVAHLPGNSTNNLIVIQVVDKVLFVIFFFLLIVLHN
ncbi:hypothetical protein TYRP_008448 [Tyrophagus putrescentiae]|nr:hypothetical protein TYRP_008448 [Tyrophagus putrescentiae]